MDASSTFEEPPKPKGGRKSSRQRRRDRVAALRESDKQPQLPSATDPERYINEILALEEKLANNWEEILATIEKLKEDEKHLDLGSFESRDEYWKLLQTEKRSEKLQGPIKTWSGHMKHRDSLGTQRAKLLSRLEQVKGSEARRLGNHPKAKASRWQGRGGKHGKQGETKVQDSAFIGGELGRSGSSTQSPTETSFKGVLSGASSGALSYRAYRDIGKTEEHDLRSTNIKEKENEQEHGDDQHEGKGKWKGKAPTTEVRHEGTGSSDDDNDECDSDDSTDFILAPPAISRKFIGNHGRAR